MTNIEKSTQREILLKQSYNISFAAHKDPNIYYQKHKKGFSPDRNDKTYTNRRNLVDCAL